MLSPETAVTKPRLFHIASLLATGLSVGLLAAGCGGSGSKAKAERMAKNELSIYPLSSAVKCSSAPASGSAKRWSCTATATGGDGTEQVAVLIQCVDGAAVCTRVS